MRRLLEQTQDRNRMLIVVLSKESADVAWKDDDAQGSHKRPSCTRILAQPTASGGSLRLVSDELSLASLSTNKKLLTY